MNNIAFLAREKIIDTNDFMTIVQKAFTKVAAEKSGAASHNDSVFHNIISLFQLVLLVI
tara:strand:+ start:23 stop:199 length:177 start_codon:yes stop_codon:yes gene_type:complete